MHQLSFIVLGESYLVCLCELLHFICCVVCVCAGMYAIRAERNYVENADFMLAVRKVSDTKKLETKMDYKQI